MSVPFAITCWMNDGEHIVLGLFRADSPVEGEAR